MDALDFAARLLATPAAEQEQVLAEASTQLQAVDWCLAVAEQLKADVELRLRNDVDACQEAVETLARFAAATPTSAENGLAALARGNLLFVGLGDYLAAVEQYDQALAIYQQRADEGQQARVLISKVGALVNLGRYDEAATASEWAEAILRQTGEMERLGTLLLNLSIGLYQRQGDDVNALRLLDEATEVFASHVSAEHPSLGLIKQSSVAPLRHLGRFDESLNTAISAENELTTRGFAAEAVRARQNRALTLHLLGRNNEALQLLDEAIAFWEADGRQRDAITAELFRSDILLMLQRYPDVVETSERTQQAFSQREMPLELAQSLINQARAQTALGQFDRGLATVEAAQQLLSQYPDALVEQLIQLQQAEILLAQGNPADAAAKAMAAAAALEQAGKPLPQCMAHLLATEAHLALQAANDAEYQLSILFGMLQTVPLPTIEYRAYGLQGDWQRQTGHPRRAAASYAQALDLAERLKGYLMVEHRALFAETLNHLYEKAINVSIELEQFEEALAYAERAKSRALLDLISQRIDVRLEARSAADAELVAELTRLRAERDRLYRQLGSNEQLRRSHRYQFAPEMDNLREKIMAHEQEITTLWHRLLVRNADYTRDVTLWQVHSEPVQSYLPPYTLLLEYFMVEGRFILFGVTADAVQVIEITESAQQIQRWVELFRMNCQRVVPNQARTSLLEALQTQAQGFLQALYDSLVKPAEQLFEGIKRLVIVPHGILHYLPFHALFDGEQYLLDSYVISTIPNASLLRFMQADEATAASGPIETVSFGFSAENALPFTVQEAQDVADIMQGTAFIDDEVTLDHLQQAANADIIHLATHGEFNPDNPLFSGLTMADGQLVTLDVFNLSLNASLVTLSACQTGLSVVSKGNELFGLMRGFLSAGARSLVLTHWAVEDESTARFMHHFYRLLQQGVSKGDALRQTQQQFINQPPNPAYAHPYYWATFSLVGESGMIVPNLSDRPRRM